MKYIFLTIIAIIIVFSFLCTILNSMVVYFIGCFCLVYLPVLVGLYKGENHGRIKRNNI